MATGSGRKASIPRLLPRLAGQWRFLPALSIDGLGYVLMVLALPALPVFVVQAAVAASLVVTAIAATRFIGATLSGREWAAVAVVWVGLGLLGMSRVRWGRGTRVGRSGLGGSRWSCLAWRVRWPRGRPTGGPHRCWGWDPPARVAISADFRAGRSRQPVWLIVDALTRADSAHRGP